MPNTRFAENEQFLNNPQVAAFLEMISKSEGTNGDYALSVYGKVISSAVHPELLGKTGSPSNPVRNPDLNSYPYIGVRVPLKNPVTSYASGKYQIVRSTYEGLKKALATTDFLPHTQDVMAVELIRQAGALDALVSGDFNTAIKKVGNVWASIPGNNYGQGTNSVSRLQGWYNAALSNPLSSITGVLNTDGGAVTSIALVALAGLVVWYLRG